MMLLIRMFLSIIREFNNSSSFFFILFSLMIKSPAHSQGERRSAIMVYAPSQH